MKLQSIEQNISADELKIRPIHSQSLKYLIGSQIRSMNRVPSFSRMDLNGEIGSGRVEIRIRHRFRNLLLSVGVGVHLVLKTKVV